jgi:hypothetical protein
MWVFVAPEGPKRPWGKRSEGGSLEWVGGRIKGGWGG